MAVHEDHAVIMVKGTCLCNCRFCARSEGRMGTTVAELCANRLSLVASHRTTIMATDLATPGLAEFVRIIRDHGGREVFVYATPACRDIMPLKALHDAGLTGIHLLLPASDRQTLAAVCGPEARLENVAMLMSGANSLGLAVKLEIPVLEQTFTTLPETLNRALKRIQYVVGVELPFLATMERNKHILWDYRKAVDALTKTTQIAAQSNIPVILGGSSGVPPCLIDPGEAVPEWYPELDSRIRGKFGPTGRPLKACRTCAGAEACVMTLEGFCDNATPVAPLKKQLELPSAVHASELFVRKVDLDAARRKAEQINRCPAPWDSLEAHDRTGRTAPCEGSWPRREVLGSPDQTSGPITGWLKDGLLKSYNSPFMQRMRQAMVDNGREYSCNRKCPRFTETWAVRPAIRVPRTRVFAANLQKSLEEFISGATVLESRPLNITVSPSLRCNQRCRMCDLTDAEAGETGIDTPDYILDELVSLLPTTATLALTGGEPLTSRRIMDIVAHITPRNLPDTRVTLTTNGTLLSPEIINRLKGTNLTAVFISLNAATPDTHALVTGLPGKFERVLQNATAMAATASTMPFRPEVVLSFVVMRSNLIELPDFLKIARHAGCGVRLLPIERDRLGESIFTDADILGRAESIIRRLRDEYQGGGGQTSDELLHLHRIIRIKMAEDELTAL